MQICKDLIPFLLKSMGVVQLISSGNWGKLTLLKVKKNNKKKKYLCHFIRNACNSSEARQILKGALF